MSVLNVHYSVDFSGGLPKRFPKGHTLNAGALYVFGR
jgi:hypothetical protein